VRAVGRVQPRRQETPEAVADGRPFLCVEDESREAVAELLAELLVGVLERDAQVVLA
jgi:hypothetical protein